jgi:hypothetical protein
MFLYYQVSYGPGLEDLGRLVRSQGHLMSVLLGEGAI